MMAKNAFQGALWIWMVCGAACTAEARTLTVAKTGGQYATVQAGLSAAVAGDTVLVKAGVYNEAVSYACKLGQSESMVLNGNVSGFIVSNNSVHDNDNIGIDFIGFEGTGPDGQDQARNGHCFGNRVYNISSAANPTYGGERSADGIYVDGGRDIVIEGNIADNCDIGFEIASEHGGRSTSGIALRNNFASRSHQGNIMAGGAYLEESGRNNTGIVADNNLYFGAGTTSPGSWSDAHALFADPKLADAPTNLHIGAGSPAIDAGAVLGAALAGTQDVDGEARVGGAKPDLGADEFSSSTGLRAGSGRPGLAGYRADRNALGRKAGLNPEITPPSWRSNAPRPPAF